MPECEYCHKDKYLLTHHESYYPEITAQICGKCHDTLIRSGKHIKRPKPYNPYREPPSKIPVIVDKMGRVTVPKKMRDALGIPEGKPWPIWIHANPSLKTCKLLVITV